jgi:hypothetical protein
MMRRAGAGGSEPHSLVSSRGSAAYNAINTSDRGSEVAAGTPAAETPAAENLHCIVSPAIKMIDVALPLHVSVAMAQSVALELTRYPPSTDQESHRVF